MADIPRPPGPPGYREVEAGWAGSGCQNSVGHGAPPRERRVCRAREGRAELRLTPLRLRGSCRREWAKSRNAPAASGIRRPIVKRYRGIYPPSPDDGVQSRPGTGNACALAAALGFHCASIQLRTHPSAVNTLLTRQAFDSTRHRVEVGTLPMDRDRRADQETCTGRGREEPTPTYRRRSAGSPPPARNPLSTSHQAGCTMMFDENRPVRGESPRRRGGRPRTMKHLAGKFHRGSTAAVPFTMFSEQIDIHESTPRPERQEPAARHTRRCKSYTMLEVVQPGLHMDLTPN